ncbi:helix-turn-helix domain-containing protein [Deinococcus hopiensis]|uniref:DNA-binding transcriptional regulator, XRE-family HTH domain n=1 Tax=Deinococcus hopiensis KR-140 TaxID=695939 RepID=A0A1W1VRD6_9DEIO|nr:helix-turn-helix transcriptional regulator [Deinococcus hopiensis]SMB95935.1 DNA-binding transcriptional regulator, XRE-family HTH domain [Deinococcus hopiensis KR-140]
MDPADAHPFPPAHALRSRRLLLGIPLTVLAQEAGLAPQVLDAVERGDYDPRSLHTLARRVLARVLDLDL